MRWTGKLVGALLGFVAGLGLVGALIGLVIGHAYDERMGAETGARPAADLATVRAVFFRTAFEVMGFVAKADGRVSEQDIAAAREIFRQFHLDSAQSRAAIGHFTVGKQPDFDLDEALVRLLAACRGRHDLLQMFLEVQMRAALLGNGLQGRPRDLLGRIALRIGVSGIEFAHLEALLRLQGYGYTQSRYGATGHGGTRSPPPRADRLREAYEVLDVKPEASNAAVKRAYRRQMSQNHPDKLLSRGLPESMLELAKEKTQAIQAAYERLREARGIR